MRFDAIRRRLSFRALAVTLALVALSAAGCSQASSGAPPTHPASHSASPSRTAADPRQEVIRSVIGVGVTSAQAPTGTGPSHPAKGQLSTVCIPAGSTVEVLVGHAVEQVRVLTVPRYKPRRGGPDVKAGAYAAMPTETLVKGKPSSTVRAAGTVPHVLDKTVQAFLDTAAGLYMLVMERLAQRPLPGSVPPDAVVSC
jgi:hypothetical protein